jgi:hypothetical protein
LTCSKVRPYLANRLWGYLRPCSDRNFFFSALRQLIQRKLRPSFDWPCFQNSECALTTLHFRQRFSEGRRGDAIVLLILRAARCWADMDFAHFLQRPCNPSVKWRSILNSFLSNVCLQTEHCFVAAFRPASIRPRFQQAKQGCPSFAVSVLSILSVPHLHTQAQNRLYEWRDPLGGST